MHICQEKDQLEDLIHECVSRLTRLSNEIFEMARNHIETHEAEQEFFLAQNKIAALRVRRDVLRECIKLHTDWHGC